jgi:hypothetical protein
MKNIQKSPLRLSRETLRRLAGPALAQARGGWKGTRTIVIGTETEANSCQAGCNTSTDSNCTDNCPTWGACTGSGANC